MNKVKIFFVLTTTISLKSALFAASLAEKAVDNLTQKKDHSSYECTCCIKRIKHKLSKKEVDKRHKNDHNIVKTLIGSINGSEGRAQQVYDPNKKKPSSRNCKFVCCIYEVLDAPKKRLGKLYDSIFGKKKNVSAPNSNNLNKATSASIPTTTPNKCSTSTENNLKKMHEQQLTIPTTLEHQPKVKKDFFEQSTNQNYLTYQSPIQNSIRNTQKPIDSPSSQSSSNSSSSNNSNSSGSGGSIEKNMRRTTRDITQTPNFKREYNNFSTAITQNPYQASQPHCGPTLRSNNTNPLRKKTQKKLFSKSFDFKQYQYENNSHNSAPQSDPNIIRNSSNESGTLQSPPQNKKPSIKIDFNNFEKSNNQTEIHNHGNGDNDNQKSEK